MRAAKPRGDRQYPRDARVFSKQWPNAIANHSGNLFVPWEDFLELRKRYVKMFKRLQYRRAAAEIGRAIP